MKLDLDLEDKLFQDRLMNPEVIAKRAKVLKRAKKIAETNARKLKLKRFFFKHPLADAIAEVDAQAEF